MHFERLDVRDFVISAVKEQNLYATLYGKFFIFNLAFVLSLGYIFVVRFLILYLCCV
jgi:hypothetical protein